MLFKSKRRLIYGGSFCVFFLGAIVSSGAFAAKESNLVGEELKRAWNAPTTQQIGHAHTLTTGCIGDSLTGCAVWTNGKAGDISYNYGTANDEGTILMMVATEMSVRGAKFCPIQIQAGNHDRLAKNILFFGCWFSQNSGSWTEYYYQNGGTSVGNNCIWLCKKGFYGKECKDTTPTLCDTNSISRSQFSGVKRVTKGTNIEDKLPMFYMNKYADYNYGKSDNGSEYDTILGITRFLNSGNGAFVAPISVRAYRHSTDGTKKRGCTELNIVSTPYLSAGTETLVCKNGYEPNSNNTDCVMANSNICAKQTACSGFSDYVQTQHTKVVNGNCYEFRCVGDKGFASSTSHSCVECTGETGRFGIANNGVCIKCPAGTVFDGEDSASDYCPRAVAYSPNVLEFGINGSAGDSISDQCWTFTDLDLYKECVQNGSVAAKKKLEEKRATQK